MAETDRPDHREGWGQAELLRRLTARKGREMADDTSLDPGVDGRRIYLSPELEQDLRQQLNPIEGHVRGIRHMLDEREECEHWLIQIAAVKAALNQVAIRLLEGHIHMCVATYVITADD